MIHRSGQWATVIKVRPRAICLLWFKKFGLAPLGQTAVYWRFTRKYGDILMCQYPLGQMLKNHPLGGGGYLISPLGVHIHSPLFCFCVLWTNNSLGTRLESVFKMYINQWLTWSCMWSTYVCLCLRVLFVCLCLHVFVCFCRRRFEKRSENSPRYSICARLCVN